MSSFGWMIIVIAIRNLIRLMHKMLVFALRFYNYFRKKR